MRVLITGGLGFIGMYVTGRLVAEGHEVVTFDTLPAPPESVKEMFVGATHYRGDLLNPMSLFEAVENYQIDTLIHLAALRNSDSQKFPYLAFRLNCEGMMNCLEAARIYKLKKMVFASTSATVGTYEEYDKLGLQSMPDDSVPLPINVYGTTKLFDELMAREYSKIYGLNLIGVRLALIFGSGKKAGSKTGLWNELIEESYLGNPVTMSRLGDLPVGINYAKDSAEAVVCAALAKDVPSRTYNCTGHCVTSSEYCAAIQEAFPQAKITLVDDDKRPNTIGRFDNELAERYLNYKPRFSLVEAFKDHIETNIKSEAH